MSRPGLEGKESVCVHVVVSADSMANWTTFTSVNWLSLLPHLPTPPLLDIVLVGQQLKSQSLLVVSVGGALQQQQGSGKAQQQRGSTLRVSTVSAQYHEARAPDASQAAYLKDLPKAQFCFGLPSFHGPAPFPSPLATGSRLDNSFVRKSNSYWFGFDKLGDMDTPAGMPDIIKEMISSQPLARSEFQRADISSVFGSRTAEDYAGLMAAAGSV
eukprot:gene27730-7376_t